MAQRAAAPIAATLYFIFEARPSGTPMLNFSSSEFERDRFRTLRLLNALAVASAAQELLPAL
jgi:hypothetical protein